MVVKKKLVGNYTVKNNPGTRTELHGNIFVVGSTPKNRSDRGVLAFFWVRTPRSHSLNRTRLCAAGFRALREQQSSRDTKTVIKKN